MDYTEILSQYDDPDNWMAPPEFDGAYHMKERRFFEFVRDLSAKLQVPLETRSGVYLQDAIYFAEVFFP
jgi:hypothetical protein